MIAITTSSSTSVNPLRLDEFFILFLSKTQTKHPVQRKISLNNSQILTQFVEWGSNG